MASKKPTRKPTIGRTSARFTNERGGARNRLHPVEPTGGGTIGGLLTPSGQGQTNI